MSSMTTRRSLVVFLVLLAGFTGTSAAASPPRAPGSGATSATSSPYAEPLDALGGQTLAQYLADRRAHDMRLY